MNSKKIITLLAMLMLISSCAKDRMESRHRNPSERNRFAREHNLSKLPNSEIPLEVNERVIAWLDYFQGPCRDRFQRYMERSGRYRNMMQDILRKNGLPEDLIYLAMIESGFSLNAYSSARAAGPWQFINSTGKHYGLAINSWVDERRDPEKATYAAVRYLKNLYDEFGDWYLAMAGYNAGEGKVRKAIAKLGTKDFWKLADAGGKYFKAETRDYVPKFIAAAIIAKMPENFGFEKINYQDPLDYEIATVDSQTDLKVISECAGVDHEEVLLLNAHLISGATPPSAKDYIVKLPKGSVERFKVKYAALPKSERILIVYHKIRKGDTINSIAHRYGVSKESLLSANNVSRKHMNRIHTGRTLLIPKGGYAKYAGSSSSEGNKGSSSGTKISKLVYYKINNGDTLGGIANKYGVKVSQIATWNSISTKKHLRVGQKLKIYQKVVSSEETQVAANAKTESKPVLDTKSNTVHKVASGETLWSISRKYSLTVSELKTLNNLGDASKIKAGQKLIVAKAAQVLDPSATESTIAADVSVNNDDTVTETATTYTDVEKDVASEKIPENVSVGMQNHKLQQGETLGGLARDYGVRVSDLMAWNNIKDPRKIRAGKVLKIKSKDAAKGQNAAVERKVENKDSTQKTHKVQKGEALVLIAKKYGVKVSDLMAWNNINNPKAVRAGQVLVLKGSSSVSSSNDIDVSHAPVKEENVPKEIPVTLSNETPSETSSIKYQVKSGDTLWDIARKHGVSISDIQTWNNLSDPSMVKPGDFLAISK